MTKKRSSEILVDKQRTENSLGIGKLENDF